MGILDKLKDKVSDMTGIDGDALVDAVGDVIEAGDSLSEAFDAVHEGKEGAAHSGEEGAAREGKDEE